ncbi:response regulator transcription factor [Paenibacillus thermotolerans]|uniref:response regulator transcription factor n=1 Tax=Paenibacillus thermotolerans TaxID=3027807 RepID=UPI0023689D82|nr:MULTISPECIES: response regulator [unclassified Paenibacillus]
MKLLVVDDEPVILQGIIRIIQRENTPFTEIAEAADGFEALEKIERLQPDLIITDIHMPEMDGLELIRRTRQRNRDDRFVILSGYNEFQYAKLALQYRVIDYLLKPIDKLELFALLDKTAQSILHDRSRERPTIKLPASSDAKTGSVSLAKIIRCIEEHYRTDLSLDKVAEHAGLHPNYVSMLLSKELGTTFLQYLHSIRMKKAQELMSEHPDWPVHVIADMVGYENQRHFFKVFKKYTGMTPGQFKLRRMDMEERP